MFMVSVVHRKLQMKYIKQKCEGKSKSYEFSYATFFIQTYVLVFMGFLNVTKRKYSSARFKWNYYTNL